MGSPRPAITTLAPASVPPSGRTLAPAVPLARSTPKSEMMEPGASGVLAAKLAPLTAAASTGDLVDSPRPPVTSRVPNRFRTGSLAVTVSVTGPELCPETQVVFHKPPWMDCRLSGGSPFDNETLTLPESSPLPQSSRTAEFNATGQAAGTPKDCPSVVITGISCVGVQPVASV